MELAAGSATGKRYQFFRHLSENMATQNASGA